MKCFPLSTHSLGGRIAFNISSGYGFVSRGGRGPFLEPKVKGFLPKVRDFELMASRPAVP